MIGEVELEKQIADGTAKVEGDVGVLKKLASTLVDFEPLFEVLPGTKTTEAKVAQTSAYKAVPGQPIAEQLPLVKPSIDPGPGAARPASYRKQGLNEDLRTHHPARFAGDCSRSHFRIGQITRPDCQRSRTSSGRGRRRGRMVQPLATDTALAAGHDLGLLQTGSRHKKQTVRPLEPDHDRLLDTLLYRCRFRARQISSAS